jgi:uncharacterized SAM-binding protein YcdF (DUF218 family)
MFFALSKIASLFLKPLIWIAILSIASLLFRSKRPNWSNKLAGFAILSTIAFTNPMLLRIALRAWEVPPVQPSELKESYTLGIILGGYSNSNDSTPEKLVLGSDPNRLSEGLRLYKTGRIKKFVLTGGTGAFFDDGVSEAPLAKKFLSDLGIPEADILVEAKSRNTHENAVFTRNLLSAEELQQTALLITSSVHMRRAQACFAKVGIAVSPYPTDLRGDGPIFSGFRSLLPDAWTLWQWEFLLREWVGSLAYRLTDRNCPSGSGIIAKSAKRAPRRRRFVNDDFAEPRAIRLQLAPEPCRHELDRWILKTFDFVQVRMIQQLQQRTHRIRDLRMVIHPAHVFIHLSFHRNLKLKTVPMHETTLMPLRRIG